MHSAEHLLNATMVRLLDSGRCFSAHIEKKKSKCDYRFDRPLEPSEIQKIQHCVNEAIQADLPIEETFISREQAQNRFNLDRLPADSGDNIRIITIGDYDACPCIGAHVSSTGAIGKFRITTTSFDDRVLRIRFKLSN